MATSESSANASITTQHLVSHSQILELPYDVTISYNVHLFIQIRQDSYFWK